MYAIAEIESNHHDINYLRLGALSRLLQRQFCPILLVPEVDVRVRPPQQQFELVPLV